jgi:hypothetical protein
MSVILQAPLPFQPSLTDAQKMEIIDHINQYRKAHQAPDLVWNDTISNYSQTWANYLIINNLFQHSGSQSYGENLAYFKGYDNDVITLIKLSIDLWYKEIDYYNFSKPSFSSDTGHFTCLVWKNSKTFGIGVSMIDNTVVVSFNTSPPGNVVGEFEQNVLPKLSEVPLPKPPIVPIPSKPIAPIMPPMDSPIAPANKTMNIVSTLQKIIEEVKKPKSNKIIIIHYLKNIIKELIHYS